MHLIFQKREITNPISDQDQSELGLNQITASLLAKRGITKSVDLHYWLQGQLAELADPFLFNQMDQAVERIFAALDNEELITVYGDYDADGITSTAVLVETLQILGANVNYYIPNRFSDGYGPNLAKYQELIAQGTKLLITVDNGITGVAEVDYAKEQGVDVIITDHHTLGDTLPDAFAIIHPKLPTQKYPFHDFSGVGVAYSLARALMDGDLLEDLLDLVAIGTVADLVSLTGENHLLVKFGLETIKQNNRLGLAELLKLAKVDAQTVSAQTISFSLAPRLNSIGRIANAQTAVELLLSDDENKITVLAQQLEDANTKRKNISQEAYDKAVAQIKLQQLDQRKTLVIYDPDFNEGVLGIVASKLVQTYHKPTLVLTLSGEFVKGSGRSIPDFDIFAALAPLSGNILTKFGGHQMACGLSLKPAMLSNLQKAFEDSFTMAVKEKTLTYDLEVKTSDLSLALVQQIAELGPFGVDFPEPLFMIQNPVITDFKRMGKNQQFFGFNVSSPQETQKIRAVDFADPNFEDEMLHFVDQIYFNLQINSFNNQEQLQLLLEAFNFRAPKEIIFDFREFKQLLGIADTYLFFHQKTAQKLIRQNLVDPTKVTVFNEEVEENLGKVTLMELPENSQQLAEVVSTKHPEQLFLKFNYNDLPITSVPTNAQFKLVMKFCLAHPGEGLAAYKLFGEQNQMSFDLIKFILNVFFELKFVKLDEGKIYPNPIKQKVSLTESRLLQKTQQRITFYQKMQNLSSAELLNYFNSLLN